MATPTRLRECGLRGEYRSDRNDVVADFYTPSLCAADRYDRAVGYFTASALAVLGEGLDAFVEHGGSMRLVASPYLQAEDIEEIEAGYALRAVLERAALRDLERAVRDPRAARGLGKLGALIAVGRLDVKLAYVSSGHRVGMYHEKIGVFRDSRDLVAYKGSANETLSGLVGNFESIEVFRSWEERDRDRALRISGDFDDLWHDRTTSLRVLPFTEATATVVERYSRSATLGEVADGIPPDGAPIVVPSADTAGMLTVPADVRFRAYQKDAVRAWMTAGGRGIFRMATGTGKTLTALAGATQVGKALRAQGRSLLVVVVVPYQHLVDQWTEEITRFGVVPVRAYESTGSWVRQASHLIDALALGAVRTGVIVTTNKTFGESALQTLMERSKGGLLVIADEVHNLGARHLRAALPARASYRLGLSATPERWFDDVGTAALTDYFGDVVHEMGIGDAIRAGALCRYSYTPVLVELDGEEAELYMDVTEKIAKVLASRDLAEEDDEDGPLGALLRKRANILGHARGKLPALDEQLRARRDDHHQLLYCAEGRHPLARESGGLPEPTQLEQALDLVGNRLRMTAARYTSETPRAQRQDILRRFTDREVQVIASMRCLDEGVDVPAARTAYLLASSSNPRQFIQRRGRVLRPAPGKQRADIVDFVVVPPDDGVGAHRDTDRRMVRRELSRVTEFARLAENEAETLDVLRPLRVRYGLLDV